MYIYQMLFRFWFKEESKDPGGIPSWTELICHAQRRENVLVRNRFDPVLCFNGIILWTNLWLLLVMFLIEVLKYFFPYFYHRIRENSFFNKHYFIQHCIIHMLYLEPDDDLESTHKPYIVTILCLLSCTFHQSKHLCFLFSLYGDNWMFLSILGISWHIIHTFKSLFWSFSMRASSGFEYEWNIYCMRVFSASWIWRKISGHAQTILSLWI